MIIVRYLIKEIFKTQIAILLILLLIFLCQKLIKILSSTLDGSIPSDLVAPLLFLGIPDMAQLILPLSLFLAILMTYSRMHVESEITVMHACGLSKNVLLKSALILALFTSFLAAVNIIWLKPQVQISQNNLVDNAKKNPSIASLPEGQFHKNSQGNIVLFIEKVTGNRFNKIFFAQLSGEGQVRPSVIVADAGEIVKQKDGTQVLSLDKGTRYEGNARLRDFRITQFNEYKAVIEYRSSDAKDDDVEQEGLVELFKKQDAPSKAEFHWRLALISTAIFMALLVVPLSEVNPRQGRVLSILPAILLYLIYFLLLSTIKSHAAKGKLDPGIWMWGVNLGYLLLALFLNSWDTVPARQLRERFLRKRSADV